MHHWIVEHEDGSVSYPKTNGSDPTKEGETTGVRFADTGRERAETERWDWSLKKWIADPDLAEARIDADFRASQGAAAISLAHNRKATEAWDYDAKKGIGGLWPMLSAEAKATGVPLPTLAAQVLAADKLTIAAECNRRVAKLIVRQPK